MGIQLLNRVRRLLSYRRADVLLTTKKDKNIICK